MLKNNWINIHKNKEYKVKYPFDTVVSFILKYKAKFERPRVLDFGCGIGNNARFVAEQKDIMLTAADISNDAIIQAKDYLNEYGLSADFVCAGVGDLPFGHEFFDMIFERGLLVCLPNDLLKVFASDCFDFLKTNGYLHITPYSFSHTSFLGYTAKDDGLFYNLKNGALANLNRGLRAMSLEDVKSIFPESLWCYEVVEERILTDYVSKNVVSYWNIILMKK
ncbi:class I SAM-dependent methyltransferase [Plesiomonas sp.]|uniref:class I SAM-dependent methyltransferase n=1 Tax=Plesiomonas sp. TaxID=2486279 RepID=UPI003F3B1E9B